MKKKIFSLLIVAIFTGITTLAQDTYDYAVYNIEFRTNSGGTITGSNNAKFLYANGATPRCAVNISNSTAYQWRFIPVGGTEPGWYHIQNVENNYYLQSGDPGSVLNDGANLVSPTATNSTKWRIINDINGFKLASRSSNGKNNTILFRGASGYTTVPRTSRDYSGNDNSIISITLVDTSPFVHNSDMEFVTNITQVNNGKFPSNPSFDNLGVGPGSTDKTSIYSSTSMFPTWFTNGGKLIHSNSASGGLVADGYYFARLAKNQTISQTMKNPIGIVGRKVEVRLWVRATSTVTQAQKPTTPYAVPDGYYVGDVSIGGLNAIPITVPTISNHENNPDGWYFYRMNFEIEGSSLPANATLVIKNVMANTNDILDIDNVQVEYADIDKLDFYYQTANTPQSVHERTQVIYTPEGTTAELSAAAQNYVYYRWYTYDSSDKEIYDTNLTEFNVSSDLRRIGGTGGHVYFNLNNGVKAATVGSSMRFTPPSGFDNLDAYRLTCDASNYMDYVYALSTVPDHNDSFTEPTLSWKHHFEIRPAWQIAAAINNSLNNNSVLETVELEAPYGIADNAPFTRIRIAPQYDATNYWLSATIGNTNQANAGTLTRGASFIWYKVASNGQRTQISGNELEYSFPALTRNNRFLQIDTSNKGRNPENETFEVEVTDGENAKTVARFIISYVSRSSSGPVVPLSGKDLLSDLPNKIFVTSETFDQTDNLFGMGTEILEQPETTYGFVNPQSFTAGGGGTHYGKGAGNSGEYSFPQAVNSGVTSGTAYSWSTLADVDDRTYTNTEGATRGNFMYIEGAELAGTFIKLNIKEELCAGSELWFSAWIVNLNDAAARDENEETTARPNLIFTLVDNVPNGDPIILKQFYTGDIGYEDGPAGTWRNIAFKFVIPEDNNVSHNYQLQVKNNGITSSGNDFALDELTIYISNPNIEIERISQNYCEGSKSLEYQFSAVVPVEYRPSAPPASTGLIYYRLLYGQDSQTAFPQEAYKVPGQSGSDFYGIIDLSNPPEDITYKSEDGTLTIEQTIPESVLNLYPEGNYTFQISAIPESLGSSCSGTASFSVEFDKLKFKAQVYGTSRITTPENVQACTNSIIDLTAYPVDAITGATVRETYFDWYYGPINNENFEDDDEAENVNWDPDLNFTGYNNKTFTFDNNGEFDKNGTEYKVIDDLKAFRDEPDYSTATAKDLETLPDNPLVNRIRYYVNSGILRLYDETAPLALNSTARYFITAIPAPSPDAHVMIGGDNTRVDKTICAGPYQTFVQTSDWGGDIVFGEITDDGKPITEYPDTYDNPDYIYTVRLPEKDKEGNDNRDQFVVPMLYIDEAHLVRVELLKVDGTFVGDDEENDPTSGIKVNNPYIGVISKTNPNKIDKDHTILANREYDSSLEPYYNEVTPYDLKTAWNLDANRSARSGALEAYPLIWNSYNYYITDPDSKHKLVWEGDPYPIGTKINDIELDNNRIALEISALGLPEEYVDFSSSLEEGFKAQFKVGSEYIFVVKVTASDSWETSSICDQYFYFSMKVVPETVSWTGTENSDWNNDKNWTGVTITGFAPTPSTNVVLPKDLSAYPALNDPKITNALEDATPYIEYDYNFTPNSVSKIKFESGSELGNQYHLDYEQTSVELNLNTMYWYGLSAPLRNMYTGDFMFSYTNPIVEMRQHNISNPQTDVYSSDWSDPFNTTTLELKAGEGFIARVGRLVYDRYIDNDPNKGVDPNSRRTSLTDTTFVFPKTTTEFPFYNQNTDQRIFSVDDSLP